MRHSELTPLIGAETKRHYITHPLHNSSDRIEPPSSISLSFQLLRREKMAEKTHDAVSIQLEKTHDAVSIQLEKTLPQLEHWEADAATPAAWDIVPVRSAHDGWRETMTAFLLGRDGGRDPKSYDTRSKNWIMFTIAAAGLMAPITSTIYLSSLLTVQKDLQTSEILVNASLSRTCTGVVQYTFYRRSSTWALRLGVRYREIYTFCWYSEHYKRVNTLYLFTCLTAS
ncbi:hypothetical protein BC938DRAFT_474423 [Jimgerdemannia flammicorona]|uniref:Uncharacterized protein n=1 Tax=Jimgerdemannia flammicorona TaxID=994334 RepID=A0A433QSJ6_9FUNG|nr:hypothetical protein BC938DRAFT_474423 [Jimgerdemannia flammicorona]